MQRMQVLNYSGERGGGFGIHLISSFSGALIGFQADDHARFFLKGIENWDKKRYSSTGLEDIERD